MSEKSPDALDLFKSVILPGKETICDYAGSIKSEMEETDWLTTIYRIEGVAVLLLIFGLISSGILFFDYRAFLMDFVRFAGLHVVFLGVIVLLLVLLRVILLAVGSINEGDSVIQLLTRGKGPVASYRFVVGLLFLFLSVVVIVISGLTFGQILTFTIFMCFILGALGVGASGVLSVLLEYVG